MKKLVVISVCMVLAAFPLLAQLPSETVPEKSDKNPVKTLYQKYENNPKVSSIYVSSEMLDLVSMLGDIHGEEFVGTVIVDGHEPFDVKDDNMVRASKILKNLKGLYLLSTEDAVTAAAMQKDLSVDGKYVEMMRVKDSGDELTFYYKSADGKYINELLMQANTEGEEFTVIQFMADSLTFQDIAALAAEMTKDSQ